MLFQKPRWIQRMSSRSRNSEVRFTERYHLDGMGNSYFERGYMNEALKQLNNNVHTGVFEINDIPIYMAWNPDHYDKEGAEHVIRNLWNDVGGQWWIEEATYFHWKKYSEQKALAKQRKLLKGQYATNAWFDIEHGLFWTWEKINLKDIARNIAKHVAWLELSPEERRAENFAARDKPTLGAKLGPLKEQLRDGKV